MSLQQIIECGLRNKFGGKPLPPHMWRAAERITACRTAALGGHVQACPDEHMERHWYNSCKHRSCPLCAFTSVERWLSATQAVPKPRESATLTWSKKFWNMTRSFGM